MKNIEQIKKLNIVFLDYINKYFLPEFDVESKELDKLKYIQSVGMLLYVIDRELGFEISKNVAIMMGAYCQNELKIEIKEYQSELSNAYNNMQIFCEHPFGDKFDYLLFAADQFVRYLYIKPTQEAIKAMYCALSVYNEKLHN